jgi:hypothetical protein
MIEVFTFDDAGSVTVDGVTIKAEGLNSYRFIPNEGPPLLCEFQTAPEAPKILPAPAPDPVFYLPPHFGVTVIGSGHGFDAQSRTSGFVLWVNGKGILVDPPVNSTTWFQENRVNTRLVSDLILTHCHADHDSGTLQKILEEGRIRVHSTVTVLRSFVAKYSALTLIPPRDFHRFFDFRPVRIGAPTTIAGARFHFKYNLHPIPTLGFYAELEGEKFYYSCDTLYDPEALEHLHETGVLSQERRDDLLNVPWDSSLIFHEAGIPPIHTPISVLADLPQEVKDKLFLVHVSESAIPDESGLQLARPDLENTWVIPVAEPRRSLSYKILDVAGHVDLFSDMGFNKAVECLTITHSCVYKPGETIIERDTPGDRFYMICSGEVEVVHEDLPERLFLTRYDYFGETALILGQLRKADIIAYTSVELLYINSEDFLRFVADSSLPKRLSAWTKTVPEVLAGLLKKIPPWHI